MAKPKTPAVAVRWRERRRSRPHPSRRRPNLTRTTQPNHNPTQHETTQLKARFSSWALGLRCRAVVVPSSLRTRNHHAATVAGARHVPVGRTVLVESVCRQGGTHSGTVPTGRGSKGVAPQRGWHSSQRPHLRKVGHGSPRNSLANTRAPPRLWWGRCGRTSTSVIVPRRAA